MQKSSKFFLIFSIILFFAVLIFVLFVNLSFPKQDNKLNNNNVDEVKGLTILSPKPNEVISSPLKITGFVNGGGWIGFEAQVGIVKLFDDKGNELGIALLPAKGEWMQVKIDFETELKFTAPLDSSTGTLVFYNENPSGEPERNKTFTLPIQFK